MKEQLMEIKKNLKENRMIAAISGGLFALLVMLISSPVYCDKLSQASRKAAEGIQSSASGMVKWIVMIVLVVVGFILIAGSQRRKEEVKERVPWIVAGVGLIVCAAGVAKLIFGWF